MSSASGVESEIAAVITGIILLFSACGVYMRYLIKKMKDRISEEGRNA